MRKIYVLFALIGLMFQSCVIKEEIHLSKKGKVEYVYDFDFSEMIKSMPVNDASSQKVLKAFQDKNGKELSLEEFLEITLAKESGKRINKDSIMEASKELFQKAKDVKVRTTINDKVGKIEFIIRSKDLNSFNASLSNLNDFTVKMQSIDGGTKDNGLGFSQNSAFTFEDNEFKRIVIGEEVEPKADSLSADPFGGMGAFFVYKMKVSFDKKIKEVSYEDAVISKDKKSFEKEFSLLEITKNPKLLEYSVELQK